MELGEFGKGKKLCLIQHISGTIHHMIAMHHMVVKCKMMIFPGVFFRFLIMASHRKWTKVVQSKFLSSKYESLIVFKNSFFI